MAKHNIVNFSYSPILGWSFSRYSTFQTCKRQYYFNYYAKFDKDIFTNPDGTTTSYANKIPFLKNLTSKHLEVGTIVHYVIAEALKWGMDKGSFPTYEQMMSKIERERKGLFAKDFFEVYYREETEKPMNYVIDNVGLALKNLSDSKKLNWIFDNAISNYKDWIIEPAGFGETRIGKNKTKAYCKVDFAFPIKGKINIVDWKTGKEKESHFDQLLGYASWANYHLDSPVEKIETIVVYLLPEYKEKTITVEKSDFENFPERVEKETSEMYSFLENVDKNIPLPKETFPMTENTRSCKFCNYKELCNSVREF